MWCPSETIPCSQQNTSTIKSPISKNFNGAIPKGLELTQWGYGVVGPSWGERGLKVPRRGGEKMMVGEVWWWAGEGTLNHMSKASDYMRTEGGICSTAHPSVSKLGLTPKILQ